MQGKGLSRDGVVNVQRCLGCRRILRLLPLLLLTVGCSRILNKLRTRARAQRPGACNLTWQVLGLMTKLELALFKGYSVLLVKLYVTLFVWRFWVESVAGH